MARPSQPSTVTEYLSALKQSEQFGPQVVAHQTSPACEGKYVKPTILSSPLQRMLEADGITALYSHQTEAIQHVLNGRDVIVSTATASGKSLIYTLPVFERILTDPEAKGLFLFPLKALAQDQLKTVTGLYTNLSSPPLPKDKIAAIYDGDTSSYRRKKIRELPPGIVITNPDMLHLSLLPYHDSWAHFLSRLAYIVIDEVHTYRGIFGSHIAWVLRRLNRLCARYDCHPTYIMTSATVGNPAELARNLTGKNCLCIEASGAAQATKHTLLLNPFDSAAGAATSLLEAAAHRKLRTIIYTQSRKMTELITVWTARRLADQQQRIASYRAGFLPEDRRQIEKKLVSGELLGVISTSALELGIDIGSLDICIMVGYPGSIMAARQRAGRVGRNHRDSLVILIGHEDAMDQFFMRHPEEYFDRDVESVTLNPSNHLITQQHLVCAAAEFPLHHDEKFLQEFALHGILDTLTAEGALLQSADGNTWFAALKYPQRRVNIRGGGTPFRILLSSSGETLGEIDGFRAAKECHQGAIYLHMARSYLVDRLDWEEKCVQVTAKNVNYFTRVLTTKSTEILETLLHDRVGGIEVGFGRLRVTEHITGFLRILSGSMQVIGKHPLELPPQIFETEGFWLVLPPHIQRECEHQRLHFMGGIHAMEHALIGMMPLFVLCDRNDIGGISHPWHDQLQHSAVFVYDGHAGGMGLSREAFSLMKKLLLQTSRAVKSCACEAGCPSCVHSPKCGSGNRPIDKHACITIMEAILHPAASFLPSVAPLQCVVPFPVSGGGDEPACPLPKNYCVFDVETRRSAQEVGGWHRAAGMGLSVGVVYDSRKDVFLHFTEDNVSDLVESLFTYDLVVGFNNKRFDNKVLSAYTSKSLARLPSFDILEVIYNQLGYRLSLDHLAEQTLGRHKQGSGLQALKWFKQGEMKKLAAYCQEDVQLTNDLFLFGFRQQYLLFQNKAKQSVRLPVNFQRVVLKLLGQSPQEDYGQTRFP